MMISFVILSTAFAQSQQGKRTKTLVTCGPAGFWSKMKSKAAIKINDYKNKFMKEKSMDKIFSKYNEALQDLMGLQRLEDRVSCLDTNQETKPCTELYTKAMCQEVAKFFRSDAGLTTCQPLGEVDGKTQLECQRPKNQRPVCNGTFYVYKYGTYRYPRCLEGWTYAAGHSDDDGWKHISDVDCTDPSCVEMSKEERLEVARQKLLDETKYVLNSFRPTAVGARIMMTDGQLELLESLQKVLEGNKSKGMFLVEVVGELLSNKWDQFKEWIVELF